MKILLYILALLFASVSLTLLALHNPGYLLITRAPWSIEMPLTLFVIIVFGAILAFYVIGHLVFRLWNMPRDVARWRLLRHTRRAQEALRDGLLQLMEGNWLKAEKRLLSDLRYSQAPLINYLAAACAAQGQGNYEKRDEYLSLSQQSAPDHTLAVGMMQTHLHYSAHQYEQALAILSQLRVQEPTRPQVLKLLAEVYRALRDWASLASLLPDLRRYKALTATELDALELETHRELLILSLPSGSVEVLESAWQFVPKALRAHPALTDIYVRHLINQNEMDKAETLLVSGIRKKWNENLVYLYGRVVSSDPRRQLETAEAWLTEHADSALLLLTLGRLALMSGIKTKARDYLERSAAQGRLPDAYAELGALMEQTGQMDEARECYRKGLQISREAPGGNGAFPGMGGGVSPRQAVSP
ncbi:MAG: heme biosynthesis HemY N-terminal domain-containing protein [Acidiferrobacteraceae bacterium]